MPDMEKSGVARALQSAGIEPDRVTTVSDAFEPVFEVRSSGKTYYAKVLSERKGEVMKDVLDRGINIGMPDGELLSNGEYVLVTDSARGRPLSFYLPVGLLPGAWWSSKTTISNAMVEIGRSLGRLHERTHMGERDVDADDSRLAGRLRPGPNLSDRFDEASIRQIEESFDEIREASLPFARIHGDPTPHNIFVELSTGAVEIIDFNLHESPAVEDLAIFEAGVELMTARLPYGRESQRDELIASFKEGYETATAHDLPSERTIEIVKLAHYGDLLNKYLRQEVPNTLQERVTRFTDRPIIEDEIRSLLAAQ